MSAQAKPPVVKCYQVDGLCCATEEHLIRTKLESDNAVREVRFDLLNKTVTVSHTGEQSRILAALREIGMPGRILDRRRRTIPPKPVSPLRSTTAAALVLMVLGGLLSLWEGTRVFSSASFLAAVAIGGWKIALKAFTALRNRSLDMNFLMTIAVLGAVALGQYAEASAVIVLFAGCHRWWSTLSLALKFTCPTVSGRADCPVGGRFAARVKAAHDDPASFVSKPVHDHWAFIPGDIAG